MRKITSRIPAHFCVGLATILLLSAAFRPKGSADTLLTEANTEDWTVEHYTMASTSNDSVSHFKKKRYDIIFDNKSDYDLDVAIRYKKYSGEWVTDAWVTLKPGEKKLMGSSDEKTYFYHAKSQTKGRKIAWGGKHKFKMGDKSLNKVRFRKQDIWECYHSEMCNTFAVFR